MKNILVALVFIMGSCSFDPSGLKNYGSSNNTNNTNNTNNVNNTNNINNINNTNNTNNVNNCGNGVIDGNESCDGTNLNFQDCGTLGYNGSGLVCNVDCTFDTSICESNGSCGDGIIQEAFESCDGTDLNGATCESLNLGTGTLSCNSVCSFNSSGCSVNEDCSDGVDNDNDTLVDCADPDCYGTGICNPEDTDALCSDGNDNDGDGLVDCIDPDCFGHLNCAPEDTDTTCSDGVDNDDDGDVDCEDSDCTGHSYCGPENNPTACSDGHDNDANGAIDCLDPSCDGHSFCSSENTIVACGDGNDNDGDGFVDCSDSDCNGVSFCGPENNPTACSDGHDNDGDGAVDCADTGCLGVGDCGPEDNSTACNDDIDNDGDGTIDCLDSGCSGVWYCNPVEEGRYCSDGIDNDEDGAIDCLDSGCTSFTFCGSENTDIFCGDGFDNDGDGLIDCDDPNCSAAAPCQTGAELSLADCTDGSDNDGDFDVDCEDSDCAAHCGSIYERFSGHDFDLKLHSVRFFPIIPSVYHWDATPLTGNNYLVVPGSGNVTSNVALGDDDNSSYNLPFDFNFYGVEYNKIFINSNGNLTFVNGDDSTDWSIYNFLGGDPRISLWWDDLTYSSNSSTNTFIVTVDEFDDAIAFTWNNIDTFVVGPGSPLKVYAQVILHVSGAIIFSYRTQSTNDEGLVGITPGNDAPNLGEINFVP